MKNLIIIIGTILLGEPVTAGLLIGFPIVLVGCWFAATGGRVRPKAVTATGAGTGSIALPEPVPPAELSGGPDPGDGSPSTR